MVLQLINELKVNNKIAENLPSELKQIYPKNKKQSGELLEPIESKNVICALQVPAEI